MEIIETAIPIFLWITGAATCIGVAWFLLYQASLRQNSDLTWFLQIITSVIVITALISVFISVLIHHVPDLNDEPTVVVTTNGD